MQFGKLSVTARGYLMGVYAIAVVLLVDAWWHSDRDVLTLSFVILVLAATLAHCFPVSTPKHPSYQLSLPFLAVALLVLSPFQMAMLLVVIHVVEWLPIRRSWLAQAFNLSTYVISGSVAQGFYAITWPERTAPIDLSEPRSLIAGLALIATFMVSNRLLIGTAIWLSNGTPPREQQISAPESLLVDGVLLAVGLPLAHFWTIAPVAVVLTAAPLFLIHRTLGRSVLATQTGRDALTHLYSGEYFTETCEREMVRCDRFGRPLAMLMLDIDHLGKVNEDYGQATGDAIIQGTAQVLLRTLRTYDVAARVFGGKFAILLPETDVDDAHVVATRLQSVIANRRFDVATSVEAVSITVTVGVVGVTSHSLTSDSLAAAANAALINAKRHGSNQVYVDATPLPADSARPARAIPSALGGTDAIDRWEAIKAAANQPHPPGREPGVGSAGSRWVHRVDRWLVGHPRPASLLLTTVVGAIAVPLVVLAAPSIRTLDLLTVLWLMTLIGLAETRDFQLSERSSYSISVVPIVAAGMLLGIPGAIVVAPVAPIVRGIRRRGRWHKVMLDAYIYIVAAAATTAAFDAGRFGQELSADHLAPLLIDAGVAGIVFYLHTFVVAAFMATELRMNLSQIWSERFRWLWPQYAVLCVLGLLLVLAYREFGILGAAAFVVPPIMMRYVAKQYIDHTVESVRQLRVLNQELADEIAHRTVVEEENARLAHEVARVSALEELSRLKSEFISIASHELRTPLTSILGFSELLLNRTAIEFPHRFMMSVIYDEAVRLCSLVDNLLDSSRIETGRMTVELQPTDLETLLPLLVQTVSGPAIPHTVLVDIAPEARWVMADVERLRQILTNLVGNAIKYSPGGGRVVISARRDSLTKEVNVSVSDQGVGIPAEYLDRVFDRFQRVDSSETRGIRGTGLGLYITRHLVELHGGTIHVDSEVGCGSTFTFTMHAAPAARTEDARHETLAVAS